MDAPELSGLLAGFGRADITPDYPVHIQGGPWKARVSTGYLDRLYATCIAMKQGRDTALLFTLDLKVATHNMVDEARIAVSQATGIPEENVLMNATHTHSAPALRYEWEGVERYRQEFNAACVKAARDAMADLSPAGLYAGSTQTEKLVHVRHYRMNDGTIAGSNFGKWASGAASHIRPADSELQLVRFARTDGRKDILLMSFPCHGTFHGNDNILSADFPGPAREYIESHSNCLAAFFQGASGDQTPGSRLEGLAIDDYREHGYTLGKYALDALDTLKKQADGAIKLTSREVSCGTNKTNLDKLDKAIAVCELVEKYGPRSEEVKSAVRQYGFSSRIDASWTRIRAKLEDTKSMVLKTLTVGGIAFVLAPYEMFGQSGKDLKTRSPFDNTFLITLYEGSYNYIPTRECCDYNCYEFQCSYFEKGTAEKLIEEYLDMLHTHKED